MQLRLIETPGIAHYAYILADGGDAAVIDPRRDVDEYITVARNLGARIRYVIDTHRQEDFVMGSAHLAERVGAQVVTGTHDLFGHGQIRLQDGESVSLGGLRIEALHTPGHTPESTSYAVFAGQGTRSAWGVFTGDTLFFGDTGRTDLTDSDRTAENAGLLHDMVHRKLAPLGDGTLILPAHGSGSVCGSGMASLPFSTLGTERRYNKVFTLSREAFARAKAAERLPRPPYFRHMERINRTGGLPPRRGPDELPLLSVQDFSNLANEQLVIDTREPEAYAGGHLRDAYSVWLGGLPVFGGWIADEGTSLYLVTDRDDDIGTAFMHLSRIGMDGVQGALAGGFHSWRKSGQPLVTSKVMTPRQLAEARHQVQLLDVRDEDEFANGHIPGARHVYVGHLERRLGDLDLDPHKPTAVTCSVGHRAGLAVSILRRAGWKDVSNLLGGMSAWKSLQLPTEEST